VLGQRLRRRPPARLDQLERRDAPAAVVFQAELTALLVLEAGEPARGVVAALPTGVALTHGVQRRRGAVPEGELQCGLALLVHLPAPVSPPAEQQAVAARLPLVLQGREFDDFPLLRDVVNPLHGPPELALVLVAEATPHRPGRAAQAAVVVAPPAERHRPRRLVVVELVHVRTRHRVHRLTGPAARAVLARRAAFAEAGP